jgi:phosphoesterase RecJ-like protein
MQNLASFKEFLSVPQKVVITTHHKPDADALGSSLGLSAFLQKKGHSVTVITPTDYPKFLHWMKGNDEVIVFNEGNEQQSAELIGEATAIFCLDFSNLHRINELGELVRASSATKVLIDHHQDPEDFADYSSWDSKAAATAELVYMLIRDMGEESLVDPDIADSLYAGIMTDTGSFKHPNTTRNVHLITAELMGRGANVSRVAKLVYDTNSQDRIRFLGYALNEKLKVMPEYRTAYFAITAEELKRFRSQTGDTEGLVNYALGIEGITLAAVIIDRTEAVKLSFRSVGDFSVNIFAREHFDGGGHKNAAGGKSDLNLQETVEKFENLLEDYKDQLLENGKPINEHA